MRNMSNEFIIKEYNTLPDEARAIREEVFVLEQGFTEEFDSTDGKSTHFLLWVQGAERAVATCRIFKGEEDGVYLLGRFAVRKAYRGTGLGRILIKRAEESATLLGATEIRIHSQARAQGFYEACGYESVGVFDEEEDCPHVWLAKRL